MILYLKVNRLKVQMIFTIIIYFPLQKYVNMCKRTYAKYWPSQPAKIRINLYSYVGPTVHSSAGFLGHWKLGSDCINIQASVCLPLATASSDAARHAREGISRFSNKWKYRSACASGQR